MILINTVSFFLFFGLVAAENGLAGWLRYAPLPGKFSNAVPESIVVLNTSTSSPVHIAGVEIQNGFQGIFNKKVTVARPSLNSASSSVIVGTVAEYEKLFGNVTGLPALDEDAFWLNNEGKNVLILGGNERGALYGTFEYLSMLAQGNFSKINLEESPGAPIRWVNQWDNMDGSIERGYGGYSLFFHNGSVVGE